MNRYFCRDCNKNLCAKCYKELKCFENEHTSWDLENNIKRIYNENINELKKILKNNIIHIKYGAKIIKKIIQYMNFNIINNNKYNYNNSINDDFLLNKILKIMIYY